MQNDDPKNYHELIINDRLIRWVKEERPEDQQYWESWMKDHPELVDDLQRARAFVRMMHFKPKQISDLSIIKMKAVIDQAVSPTRMVRMSIRRTLLIAATLTILVLSGWFIYRLADEKIIRVPQVITLKGQKTSIMLPDGSRVWLNGGSTLVIEDGFMSDTIRSVSLKGEAFFEVKSGAERPFIVKTTDLAVRVLGTSFNVKSYTEDSRVETSLVEGRLELQTGSGKVIQISPGNQAVYHAQSRTLEVRSVNAQQISEWRNGLLVLEEEPFGEVAKVLERWYGTSIRVEKGTDCRVSAKIQGESLREVLELLKLTSRVGYTIIDGTVVLEINCNREK